MDACTTSPVESNNNSIKHGSYAVHANMNLDKSTERMIDGFDNRLRRRRNTARRDMLMTNNASCAPTKHLFIKQGQGLIDRNHDRSEYYKSAQIGPYRWLAWNFDNYEYANTDNVLNLHIPWFMRVRELTVVHSACGRPFVKCTCNARKRHGVPCSCFFKLADDANIPISERVSVEMVDVRYLKIFNAHYGEDTDIGNALLKLQTQCFQFEDFGIPISTSFLKRLTKTRVIVPKKSSLFDGSSSDDESWCSGEEDNDHCPSYPILGKYTTDEDLEEAMHVKNLDCCDQFHLEKFRMMQEISDSDNETDINMTQESLILTSLAANLQDRIKLSEEADMEETLPTEDENQLYRKNVMIMSDNVLNDEMGDQEQKKKFMTRVEEASEEYFEANATKWGANGGGMNRLELYGHNGGQCRKQKRKRGVM